jgi:hypothetical protein
MKTTLVVYSMALAMTISPATARAQPDDTERLLRVIEDEMESPQFRGELVDKLTEMSANNAAPRLLKMLVERKRYADILAQRILVYFEVLPTSDALPSLLKYEQFANQNGITMASKVRTAFVGALEACKKVQSGDRKEQKKC